jgi:acetyl esterase
VVIYIPEIREHPQPAYVYLHGGGYRMGDPRSNDRQMRELAAAWGGIVVSADYVHMPEYVFPSAVEETAAVYQWLAANGAQWGIDGQRLAFGGSSAGANVALGAAIHLGGISTGFLRAGALVVGTYDGDDSDTGSMRLYADVGLFPSRASSKATLEQYVPDPAMRSDPRVKCIAADPAILPPLFLAAAEFDVFRDSSRRLAERMASAGRPYQLKEYAGMAHLFSGYTRIVDRALECVHDMAAFLKEHVPAK